MAEPLQAEAAGQDPAQQPPKGALFTVFLIVFVDLLGFGIIIPLLPFYVRDLQNNPFKVTFLFSIFSICQFIGAPILGAISDRVGRRPVLALSQFGSALGYAILGLSTQFHFTDATLLLLVYISRIIDGFTGGNVSTAQAYISDITTPQNRAKGMGMIGAAFGVGFAFGPAMGGVLGAFHPSLPAYVAAGFSLAAGFLTLSRLKESVTHKPTEVGAWLHPARFAPIFRNGMLMNLLGASFWLMTAFVMMEATIGLFLNHLFGWKSLQVGLYFAYVGIVIAFVQGRAIGKLVKRFGDWPLAIAGPLFVALGMAGYIWTGYRGPIALTFTILLITGAANALGRSLQMPTLSSLISKFSDRSQQGVVFGLSVGLSSLARVIGPILAGQLYPFKQNTAQYWAAGAIALAVGFWLLAIRRPAPHEAAVPTAGEVEIEQL